jgi:DNA uptake protein ComE-like DNA-binding protein
VRGTSGFAPNYEGRERTETAQPVDINRASLQELEKVPGITPTWAARIIRFRPYRTKLDLLDQGVLTPEVYQRIRERVIAHRTSPQSAEQH